MIESFAVRNRSSSSAMLRCSATRAMTRTLHEPWPRPKRPPSARDPPSQSAAPQKTAESISRKPYDTAFQGYGRMTARADGSYVFRTIRPVAYPGRTPHIHFAVRTPSGRPLVTQMYVPGEPLNAGDSLYASIRDPRQREAVTVALAPANGIEPGALGGNFDIVLPT